MTNTNDEKPCCKNLGEACECKNEGCGEGCGNCEVKAGCAQCDEYKNGWQRALADYENLKRDMARMAAESRNRIKSDFASQLLPVMDNFDQAVAHAPELADPKLTSWLQGVTFIKQQFAQVLTDMGLERIGAEGAFDPHMHDAVEERAAEGVAAGTILQVISDGWKMGEVVIRPAKVIVSKE